MKKLALISLILIALSTGAFAHKGSIGLYTNTSATDCDVTLTPYVGYDVSIMYFRSDGGPDGISAAEFKVSAPATVVVGTFIASPDVSVAMGDIKTALSVSFTGCAGSGQDYTLIGTVNILNLGSAPMLMQVLTADGLPAPPYEPRVAICPDPRPLQGVLGGYFGHPDGSCNTGTEDKTWGAIKEMYRD
jgi:hypothetical protein